MLFLLFGHSKRTQSKFFLKLAKLRVKRRNIKRRALLYPFKQLVVILFINKSAAAAAGKNNNIGFWQIITTINNK